VFAPRSSKYWRSRITIAVLDTGGREASAHPRTA
jgi:hypothetical protein